MRIGDWFLAPKEGIVPRSATSQVEVYEISMGINRAGDREDGNPSRGVRKGDSYKALNIMAIAAGRIVGNMGEKQELEAMERI